MKIGIMGLAQSGKTTVFNAVCPHHQDTHIGAARMEVTRGIVKVPDDRLWELEKIYQPQKVTQVEIEFMDVSGMSGKIGDAQRVEKEIPPALREAEVLAQVVRAFESELIVHPEGSVDPARDIQAIEAELIFNDFVITESRLERVVRQARLTSDESAKRELAILQKIKAHLEQEQPLRDLELSPDEQKLVKGFQFLSQKPKLLILNVDEKDIIRMDAIADTYQGKSPGRNIEVVSLCAKIQAELNQLEEADRKTFMQDLGLAESALDKMIHKSFSLLGLITFLTGGDKEVHAWTVPRGTKAPQAAGAIHKDFEKGFIKVDIYSYDDLIKYGSEAEARKHGALRVEGKDYVMQEGDTVFFKFNL